MLHALALALALLLQQKIDEKKVRELMSRFASDEIVEREQAMSELLALGEGVVPILEKAREEADGETKARIEKLISELTLPARWAKEFIEGEPSQAYQKIDEALRGKTLERAVAGRILSAVLLSEAASSEHRQYVVNLVERHRIREVWPAFIQFITQDDPEAQNYVYYLQRLRPPREAVAHLLKAIPKVDNFNVSYQLLEIARSLKPERAAMEACVGAIIEGDDDNLRYNVLSGVQQGRYPAPMRSLLKCWRAEPFLRTNYLREPILHTPAGDAAAEIVGMLASSENDDVSLAIDYIARHRVAAGAEPLAKAVAAMTRDESGVRPRMLQAIRALRCEAEMRKWIAGDGGPGRVAALALAVEIGQAGVGPDVVRALDDADAAVRREAALAAGALRLADAAGRLEALLKDADASVRRQALVALATLRGKAATPLVLAQLRSEDADIQAAAVECLPLVNLDEVLALLTSDDGLKLPIARYALAAVVVQGGQPMLHRVMARVGAKLPAEELQAQIRLIQSVPPR